MNKDEIIKDLINSLATMDIPITKLDVSNFGNVAWLLRNIQFKNTEHPKYAETVKLLKVLHSIFIKSRQIGGYQHAIHSSGIN